MLKAFILPWQLDTMEDTTALDHISERGRDILGGQSLMSFKFDEVRKNTYHSTSNPKVIWLFHTISIILFNDDC